MMEFLLLSVILIMFYMLLANHITCKQRHKIIDVMDYSNRQDRDSYGSISYGKHFFTLLLLMNPYKLYSKAIQHKINGKTK